MTCECPQYITLTIIKLKLLFLDGAVSTMTITFFLGSPIELESEGNTSSQYDSVSQHSMAQLEIPQQERLLPIGAPHSMANLVQHVRQVLGVHGKLFWIPTYLNFKIALFIFFFLYKKNNLNIVEMFFLLNFIIKENCLFTTVSYL